MEIKSDIEIAQACEKKKIAEIAAEAGVDEKYLEQYGNYKAKVDYALLRDMADRPDGKLVLVTAITPTPAGEGKTTTTMGLADGLRRLGKNRMVGAAGAQPGPGVRRQGRRRRRRLCPGGAHGGY
jgi:formate--tetrahydrofolate ligase